MKNDYLMRRLSSEETYFYFKDRYKDSNSMIANFNIIKKQDKENKFKNKKYLLQSVWGFFDYNDVIEMLKYEEEVHNTILYAQQLIIDIEALIEKDGTKGNLGKIAKLVGIPQQSMGALNISYNMAIKIINNIETKLKSISYEALQDLKVNYHRLSA